MGIRVNFLKMIKVSHVFKTYPNKITALSDVSLEIFQGEFIFISGSTGSGKSTLFRILFCEERPTSGEVFINGFHITHRGFKNIYQLRRNIGIIPQNLKLLKDRSVNENIAFALEVIGNSPREVRIKVSEIIRMFGLEEKEKESIHSLSSGEQQLVAIARALVKNPSLILADEPTGLLDHQMTDHLIKIFIDLNRKGTTILFTTKDMGLIKICPQKVILLERGKRVDDGG